MTAIDDLVVILRTSGQRTSDASLALLREQVPSDRIRVVSESESSAAIRRTYELGLEHAAAWTMTLGADALLRAGAVREFVAEANRMPAHYFQIECRAFDKVTGLYRQAGQRIYRTGLLRQALRHIPRPGTSMRSEYTVLQAMGTAGHPSRGVALVAGLHNFEQYYRDIYEASFVHAVKHTPLIPSIVRRCLEHWGDDDDFRVVLRGLYDGLMPEPGRARHLPREAPLAELGLAEKAPLLEAACAPPAVARMFRTALAHNAPPRFEIADDPAPRRNRARALWQAYATDLARNGWWAVSTGALGRTLRRLGERLDAGAVRN
jgi:hypothetical protein